MSDLPRCKCGHLAITGGHQCIKCHLAFAPDAKGLRGQERFTDAQRHSRGSGRRAQDRFVEKLARDRNERL